MEITIVPMNETHFSTLAGIERLCFSDPWSEQGFKAELENHTARFYVALKDGSPVGYAGMHNVAGGGYITNVAVHPDHRREGIARMLIGRLMEASRREGMDFITLEVRPSNHTAIALYRAFGFETVGRRRKYYRRPTEDALLMTVYLRKETGEGKS